MRRVGVFTYDGCSAWVAALLLELFGIAHIARAALPGAHAGGARRVECHLLGRKRRIVASSKTSERRVNLAAALSTPIADVAGRDIDAFDAVGDAGIAGAACFGTSLTAALSAQASISVSVEASATRSVSGS